MLEPIRNSEWNPTLAAHLLNRAGFGATPEIIQEFASLTPKDAVNRIVYFNSQADQSEPPDWTGQPDARTWFDESALKVLSQRQRQFLMREERQLQAARLMELQRWWLNRMKTTPSPLEEKLTLFWHGHFATSFEKVQEVYALYLQNQTFRKHAAGNFKNLVVAVAQDPAMLIYLDNAISNKDAPNENFARELMELFTLGEGNYSESDIRASARAFTGWSVDNKTIQFINNPHAHDNERKMFMTFTGNLDGYDVIGEILEHPVCPEFIASKIWRYFAYDDMESGLAKQLGRVFYDSEFELKSLMETIFMSREFYSWKAAYSQIKSPVQWLVGSSIALEGDLPDAPTCSSMLRSLGQELFLPPNVKGWDGGASWITAASMMQRYNLAGYLVKGAGGMKDAPDPADPDAKKIGMQAVDPVARLDRVLPEKKRATLDAAWEYLEWRIYQRRLKDKEKYAVRQYLTMLPMPSRWSDGDLQNLLHVMMSTPYYQVF